MKTGEEVKNILKVWKKIQNRKIPSRSEKTGISRMRKGSWGVRL